MSAAQAFQIKQWDTLPLLEGVVKANDGSGPIDLASAADLRFMMRPSGLPSPVISDTSRATIINASEGRIAYAFASGHTATADYFEGEFQVIHPGSQIQTIPQRGYIPIRVLDDIGP
jgi:hypothetical protein